MSNRKSKPLTPEQRVRKNERERERKARLKAQAAQPKQHPTEQPPEVSVASITYSNSTESEEPLTAFDVYMRRQRRESRM